MPGDDEVAGSDRTNVNTPATDQHQRSLTTQVSLASLVIKAKSDEFDSSKNGWINLEASSPAVSAHQAHNLARQGSAASEHAKRLWARAFAVAIQAVRAAKDPWGFVDWDSISPERAIRHQFEPETRTWRHSEETVKMEPEKFASGALRSCFRMKKLSKFVHHKDWKSASAYVAKQYTKQLDSLTQHRLTVADIEVQMTSKKYAMRYNLAHPPKPIDILQCFVLELPDREGHPWFACERFVDGDYIKHSSNAGFVDSEHIRNTPHAFTHYTFVASNGAGMVCDIQGVGDLWTDPQIHTSAGREYGEGNLGVKGFALFFHTHRCNPICKQLKLEPVRVFDYEVSVKNARTYGEDLAQIAPRLGSTVSRSRLEIERPSLKRHNTSAEIDSSEVAFSKAMRAVHELKKFLALPGMAGRSKSEHAVETLEALVPQIEGSLVEYLTGKSGETAKDDGPLDLEPPNLDVVGDQSPYAAIYVALARYHLIPQREDLSEEDENSRPKHSHHAAVFYFHLAANLGSLTAQLALANLYADLPRNELADVFRKPNPVWAFQFALMAARNHSRVACIRVGRSFAHGDAYPTTGDPPARVHDNFQAHKWLRRACELGAAIHELGAIASNCTVDALTGLMVQPDVESTENLPEHASVFVRALETVRSSKLSPDVAAAAVDRSSGSFESDIPTFELRAECAEMLEAGGHRLDQDWTMAAETWREAADEAVTAQRGARAAKFYVRADQAEANAEDDDDAISLW